MAIAIGILYLVDYGKQVRQTGRWVFPGAVFVYSAGALMGLGFFIAANILPDPDAFFRTAGNAARFSLVSADLDAPVLERLLKSFTAISIFWTNLITRVTNILRYIHPVELILWIAAFASLFWRRSHRAILPTVVLSISVVAVGFFILNNGSLAYTAHLGPALLLCVPPFFTYGFSCRISFEWEDITPCLVLILATCVFPAFMTTSLVSDIGSTRVEAPHQLVTTIKTHISTQCRVIGPEELFAFDLPMYGLYYSGEGISTGQLYYNYESDTQLWQTIDPDIAIVTDTIVDTLKDWLSDMDYEEIYPFVWRKTHSSLSPD